MEQASDKHPDFVLGLAELVSADPLSDKILLCPSQRVGRQWLDQAALVTGGVMNVRTSTLRRLVQDLAEPVLRSRGLRPATREEKTRLIGTALERMAAAAPGSGYFTRLPASIPLVETLLASLEELETANINGASRFAGSIGSREKADELARLIRNYRAAKGAARIAGAAETCQAAASALEEPPGALPILIVPAFILDEATHWERRFLSRWPAGLVRRLADDTGPCRAELSFLAADCVANEARQLLRTLQERAIPLDQVEAVCLDQDAYTVALCAAGLETFGGRPEDLPITFNGGIPGFHARPVRLLTAWLDWLEADLPPENLARMIDSGLLGDGWRDASSGLGAERLAERLRALPINGGPDEYRRELGRGGKDGEAARAEAWLAALLPDILPLTRDGNALALADAPVVLRAARNLLRFGACRDGKLDAYARTALAEALAAWIPFADWNGFNAVVWLRDLAAGLRVMGLGPMPGRLHVSDLAGGGHTGRKHTFILGLDDTRFPGSVRQDPVLLDRERRGLSRNLPASGARRERREKAFERLLARLRGRAYFSYARHDADGRREQYPAAPFGKLMAEAGASAGAATLRPVAPGQCLVSCDDWLYRLLDKRANTLTPEALAPWHPRLAAGGLAARERAAERFTEWDGHVPEAGKDYAAEGWQVSPTDMETLAACPMDFFFRRVLRIRPPDRYQPTPGRWLEGNERGSLLHDLFQDFLGEMAEKGGTLKEAVDWDMHRDRLVEMLDRALARQRRSKPPRDRLAYERERAELFEACVIFLVEEAVRLERGKPVCLEVSLGGAEEDAPPWNRSLPVELPLPSGGRLLLRGRVDRIDRLHNHGGLVILDYKTGSSGKYSRSDPFNQGRHLQPLLYANMVERVLKEQGLPEPVRAFSYFFPMPRDEGRTFTYTREQLREGGLEIVGALAEMLTGGLFPFTTDPGDVRYSDYLPIYGDIGPLVAGARAKAAGDPALEKWAELRGL